MRSKASAVGLLAVAGVVLGHTVGYTLADPTAGPTLGHGYLDVVSVVVLPLGALALAILAVRAARVTELEAVDWRRLAALQVALFAGLEVYERFVVGTLDTLVSEPGVALGLLAQLPIAFLLAWLVRIGARAVARLLDPWQPGPPDAAPVAVPPLRTVPPTPVTALRFTRGPPPPLG